MKKMIIGIITLLLLILGLKLLTGYTVIIPISKYKNVQSELSIDKRGSVNPLNDFNFKEGDWEAYFIVSLSDFKELPPSFSNSNCFKTKDVEVLESMKANWVFQHHGGDMSTVESKLMIFNEGKLVYETGVVVSEASEGLQSKKYGWLDGTEGEKISTSLLKFSKVQMPVIIL